MRLYARFLFVKTPLQQVLFRVHREDVNFRLFIKKLVEGMVYMLYSYTILTLFHY